MKLLLALAIGVLFYIILKALILAVRIISNVKKFKKNNSADYQKPPIYSIDQNDIIEADFEEIKDAGENKDK